MLGSFKASEVEINAVIRRESVYYVLDVLLKEGTLVISVSLCFLLEVVKKRAAGGSCRNTEEQNSTHFHILTSFNMEMELCAKY